jgi:hypothetical protein
MDVNDEQRPVHILFVPFLAPGHLIPTAWWAHEAHIFSSLHRFTQPTSLLQHPIPAWGPEKQGPEQRSPVLTREVPFAWRNSSTCRSFFVSPQQNITDKKVHLSTVHQREIDGPARISSTCARFWLKMSSPGHGEGAYLVAELIGSDLGNAVEMVAAVP